MRPWQHVLEPLAGYLQLAQNLLAQKTEYQGAWNFGPEEKDIMSVSALLDKMKAEYVVQANDGPHETKILMLDSSKARNQLNWRPVLSIDDQIKMTSDWYSAFNKQKTVLSREQLSAFQDAAKKAKAAWA